MEDFISMSIKELTDYLEECDPFSEEAMNIHDALFSKVGSEILRCFDAASKRKSAPQSQRGREFINTF